MPPVKEPTLNYSYGTRLTIVSIFIAITLFLLGCQRERTISTASESVTILPFQFVLSGLDRQRTLRLYLPPDYASSEKRYPVLYMHDGQNLFDEVTAEREEWGVDETLDNLAVTSKLEVIVVAIDHGGEFRMNELSPWENKRFGEAQGKAYMDFVVEVVKPFIDTNYRTLPDKEHTAIAGGQMGGLISHYAIHAYPDVFGKAALFSPAYWYSADVFAHSQFQKASLDAKIYVVYSKADGDGMLVDTGKMQRQFKQQGHPRQNLLLKRVDTQLQNEVLWQSEFAEAMTWLFAK